MKSILRFFGIVILVEIVIITLIMLELCYIGALMWLGSAIERF